LIDEYDFQDDYDDFGYEAASTARDCAVTTHKKNKKRKPLPTRPHIPRILKRDPRRDLGSMFVNVFNLGDYDTMISFLTRYHRADHVHRLLLRGQEDPVVTVTGLSSMARYLYERMYDAADLLFRMRNQQILVRSDGTALITADYDISGTRVVVNGQNFYQMLALQALQQELELQAPTNNTAQQRVIRPQEFSKCSMLVPSFSRDDQSCSSSVSSDSGLTTLPPAFQFSTVQNGCSSIFTSTTSIFSSNSPSLCAHVELKDYQIGGRMAIFIDASGLCEKCEFVRETDVDVSEN